MGLYIRDDGVNELASRLARLTGQTKTQAVRDALESRLAALPARETLKDFLAVPGGIEARILKCVPPRVRHTPLHRIQVAFSTTLDARS